MPADHHHVPSRCMDSEELLPYRDGLVACNTGRNRRKDSRGHDFVDGGSNDDGISSLEDGDGCV